MAKVYEYDYHREIHMRNRRTYNYGCFGFILDCILTLVTGGLWLIWVFVREMRRRG